MLKKIKKEKRREGEVLDYNESHVVSKINRAVSIKIAIEYSKIYNILVMKKRPGTVSQRRRVDKTKSF